MNKKTGKIFILITGTILSIFIFGVNPSFALVGPVEINNESLNKNFLEAVNIKLEGVNEKLAVADEKENAYNKAINELKLFVSFFGLVIMVIIIILGIWRNNKIVDAKKEIMLDIENKKKSLEEKNEINIDKKILDLDKYKLGLEKAQILASEKIKDEIELNNKDIQRRLMVLEIKEEKNKEDEGVESDRILLKDEENKNENPYE